MEYYDYDGFGFGGNLEGPAFCPEVLLMRL